jgi:hypothetical protein
MSVVGPHGGKRPGAGRPKREGELHSVTVRLDAQDRALMDRLCAQMHLSQSELVSRALDALAQKNPSK